MLAKLVRPCAVLCGRILRYPLGSIESRNFSFSGTKRRKQNTKVELSNTDEEYVTKKYEDSFIKRTDEIDDDAKQIAAESNVKRRMTGQQTMYGKLMKEAEPEDERDILEYYVRKAQDAMAESDDTIEYDVVKADKKLFFKMVDLWIQDAGEVRRGHREFVQVALNNLERFNVQHEPGAYLKILQCYPQSEHTGLRRNNWFKAVWQDKILDHEIGVRLFKMMQKHKVVPSDEFYDVCTNLFGIFSRASAAMRSMLFWYPRLTNFSAFPVSYKDMEDMSPAEIATRGLRQAHPALDASYQLFEVDSSEEISKSSLNCIISVQTRDQKELLQDHDSNLPVFVEGPNLLFFENRTVQYYILRGDPIEKRTTHATPQVLTDKEWWAKFYGKDFKTTRSLKGNKELFTEESFFPSISMDEDLPTVRKQVNERNQISEIDKDVRSVEGQVYAIAATDLKSVSALRGWIHGLESSNPVLSDVTVLFNEKKSFLTDGFKAAVSK